MGVGTVLPVASHTASGVQANRLSRLWVDRCVSDRALHFLRDKALSCGVSRSLFLSSRRLVRAVRPARGLIPQMVSSILILTKVEQRCSPSLGVRTRCQGVPRRLEHRQLCCFEGVLLSAPDQAVACETWLAAGVGE